MELSPSGGYPAAIVTYKLKSILCFALVVGLFGCASEKHARHESQAALLTEARVSKADAQETALAQVPNGTIKEGELEREHGKLIWSFDIAAPDSKDVTEVNVDAITGKVAKIEKETSKHEGKEKEEDSREEKK